MTGPTLREIADQMYATLSERAPDRCHVPLKHGLHIVLERCDDMLLGVWSLKLGRQQVYPSDLEVTLCKRAYRLADDHPDTRLAPTAAGWHVIALRWQGAIPAPKRTS